MYRIRSGRRLSNFVFWQLDPLVPENVCLYIDIIPREALNKNLWPQWFRNIHPWACTTLLSAKLKCTTNTRWNHGVDLGRRMYEVVVLAPAFSNQAWEIDIVTHVIADLFPKPRKRPKKILHKTIASTRIKTTSLRNTSGEIYTGQVFRVANCIPKDRSIARNEIYHTRRYASFVAYLKNVPIR